MGMGSSPGPNEATSSRLAWDFSNTGPIEEDAFVLFSIVIYDKDSGAIASDDIDITGIAVELAKSTGGAAFSAVGIAQPVFGKENGRVYINYRMLLAQWNAGDMYRHKVSGITADIDGDTKSIPAAEWTNIITELVNIEVKIDAIQAKTDNLPADPASETNVDATETKVDTLQTDVTSVKAKTDLLIEADSEDSFIKITTDAGVNDFPVLRFDLANGNIEAYDSDEGDNWKEVTSIVTPAVYEILDLIFDLLNAPTGGQDFETLSVGGDITFALKRQVNNNLIEEGKAKKYTAGSIEADPITDGESGNVIVDGFQVSDYVEVWIMTSQALTDLEIPFRFNYNRIG